LKIQPQGWFFFRVNVRYNREVKQRTTFIVIALFAILVLHFYSLATIKEKIFDEIYFPVFADNYLTKTDFYDAHPPLGKLIIAVGIIAFGNNPFGWRVMSALAGLAILAVMYGFTLDLTKNRTTALLALFLAAIEPMLLVESRVGLINIYLGLFSILGLWLFWRWYEKGHLANLIFALLAFGAAVAVKWIGLGAFGAALLFWLVMCWQKKQIYPRIKILAGLLLLLIPLVYLTSFIPDILRGQDIVWWHQSSWNYHAHLNATHPYGSAAWTWPLMLRPIWLYYDSPTPSQVIGIIEIGNIFTWIGGLAAVVFLVYQTTMKQAKQMYDRNFFLILTYLALYLPWFAIGRVKFIYHYFIPMLILLIMLAIVLSEKVLNNKDYKWYGYIFLGLATLFFIYFLPLLMGLPISEPFYRHHMWLQSWI
jgi:dolichyl-phosphate-mannose-protein mannosyltransferase